MKSALLHVSVPFVFCVILVNTSLFDDVTVDLSYDHYAEKPLRHLPAFLAMPFNCLVNAAYLCVALYWLLPPPPAGAREPQRSRYIREVFALMLLFYAPVQWTRLALLRRAPAVLDQWMTLPIVAWVPVWIGFIERGWSAPRAAALELCSVLSYGLALAHERGFEAALGGHLLLATYGAVRVQLLRGDGRSRTYLLLAALSCCGFVGLKLLDHRLAQYGAFQTLTGHFWSKVCDVLQFHFSSCFLSTLTPQRDL
ncbi:transmembrane protein 187 [Thalassophryne amazonica]|uniref:transmembrane protein 187 n=1 Tax=Thalassophryne amazonica TaxID=390379 RepID=UPI001471E438|nr:transmembrane protein 187 [Thalassophryne amazonica]